MDEAYSSRAIRSHLRGRGINTVIQEPRDQQGHRTRRGSRDGRPVDFDANAYRNHNVIERRFCHTKQWRGTATRYDKHAGLYRAAVLIHATLAWPRELATFGTVEAESALSVNRQRPGGEVIAESPGWVAPARLWLAQLQESAPRWDISVNVYDNHELLQSLLDGHRDLRWMELVPQFLLAVEVPDDMGFGLWGYWRWDGRKVRLVDGLTFDQGVSLSIGVSIAR